MNIILDPAVKPREDAFMLDDFRRGESKSLTFSDSSSRGLTAGSRERIFTMQYSQMRIVLLIFYFLCSSSMAKVQDLGVYGQVFPIIEESMQQRIMQSMRTADWQSVRHQLADQAGHWSEHLPAADLPAAQGKKTIYFSPAVVLKHDIRIKGQVIYHQGTPINPLLFIRPQTALLFFDGRSAKHIAFAMQMKKHNPQGIKLVITAGDPMKLSKQFKTPVFYALPVIIHRFRVTALPALLKAGEGEHRYELALTIGG